MQNLVTILNELIEKYQMSNEDIMMIQGALAALEGSMDEEFVYEEE